MLPTQNLFISSRSCHHPTRSHRRGQLPSGVVPVCQSHQNLRDTLNHPTYTCQQQESKTAVDALLSFCFGP
jgi:hypothetical protein